MSHRSHPLVDPELLGLLAHFPPFSLDADSLSLLRGGSLLPTPAITNPGRVEKRLLAAPGVGGAPAVGLTLYRPVEQDAVALPCIYYIHGGGYVGGTAASAEARLRTMVEDLACVLVAVEYRLAPETPYPGPLDDCRAGLTWLIEQADALGIDPDRVGVSGESAGGGLAAALALLLRDQSGPRLAFQHLLYPMLDDRTCAVDAPHPYAGGFLWTPASNAFGWRSYLGAEPGSDGIPAYAAPARAADLAGLPPTFLAVGALDLFVDEDMAYAARLIRAGIPTELHVYPGGFHAFDRDPAADVAIRMRRDSLDALRRFTASRASSA